MQSSRRQVSILKARRGGAVVASAVLGLSLLAGGGVAHADPQVLQIASQPVERHGQIIPVFTDAPAGTGLDVYMNGKLVDRVALWVHSTGDEYVPYDSAWGLGTLQFRAGETQSNRVSLTASVRIRTLSFKRLKNRKRLRVNIRAVRYNPKRDAWVRTANPVLQRKQGKWRTVTRIKTNKAGRGKAVLRPKKAFVYRVVVAKTKNSQRLVVRSKGRI